MTDAAAMTASSPARADAAATALWTLDGVVVGSGGPPRLGPLTLVIRPGVTAILGHSGAGKTTLCNLLAGFERPTSGSLAERLPRASGRLPLYWAPHDALWPHLDARGHLAAVAPRQARLPPAAILDALGLSALAGAHPERMSAGERARLTVARALASEAAVLVLDEPFAHVDPASRPDCWRALLGLAADLGASLVYATHEPEWVLGCAQRVICLRRGALIAEGPVADLYAHPADAGIAACFGEANWLAPGESATWLEHDPQAAALAHGGCIRPERLAIVPEAGAAAEVRESSFHGALARTTLERAPDAAATGAARREFVHRPSAALVPGQRVALRLLALLAMATIACVTGCGSAPSSLGFAATGIQLPNDGRVQPAPRGLAVTRAGEILVLDTVGRVLAYAADGTLKRQWRMPAWDVGRPEGIVELHDGRVAVADTHYHRVVFFDHDGAVLETRGSEGSGPGQFNFPISVDEDPAGNLYVSEYGGNDRVQKFSKDGDFVCQFGAFGTGTGQFQRPQHVCWHDAKVYVADAMNNRVQVFSDAGAYVGVLGEGLKTPPTLSYPYGLWVAPDHAVWVAEYSGNRVVRLAPDGHELGAYGSAGHGDGEFATPWSLVGAAGGAVWVADTGNRRLVRLDPTGAAK